MCGCAVRVLCVVVCWVALFVVVFGISFLSPRATSRFSSEFPRCRQRRHFAFRQTHVVARGDISVFAVTHIVAAGDISLFAKPTLSPMATLRFSSHSNPTVAPALCACICRRRRIDHCVVKLKTFLGPNWSQLGRVVVMWDVSCRVWCAVRVLCVRGCWVALFVVVFEISFLSPRATSRFSPTSYLSPRRHLAFRRIPTLSPAGDNSVLSNLHIVATGDISVLTNFLLLATGDISVFLSQ